jgi:hypothetical protein
VLEGKTCPSATLPTINLTGTDVGLNPGLRGERPATVSTMVRLAVYGPAVYVYNV